MNPTPNPGQSGRARALRLITALFVVICSVGLLAPLFATKDRALVRTLVGSARIYDAGTKKWKPLRVDAIVSDNSWVETGRRSKLTIFYRGTEVRLGAKTKVRINNLVNEKKPASVYVRKGFTWYGVKKRAFEVRTPTAIASVRGTKFAVATDKGGTATCICDGVVDVGRQAGSTQAVKKGFSLGYKGKQVLDKDFRKFFKGLKVDKSFESEIKADGKMAGCRSCHRMTDLATDKTPDPKDY